MQRPLDTDRFLIERVEEVYEELTWRGVYAVSRVTLPSVPHWERLSLRLLGDCADCCGKRVTVSSGSSDSNELYEQEAVI